MNRSAKILFEVVLLNLAIFAIDVTHSYSNTYFPESIGLYWNYHSSGFPGELYKTTLTSYGTLTGEQGNYTAYSNYVIIQDSVYTTSGHIVRSGETVHSFVDTPLTLGVPSSTVPGIYQSEIINHTETYESGTPSASTFLYTLEVIGFEDVSVSAGYFSNCLKLYSELTDTEEGYTVTTNTSWLAPNVGAVKREGTFFQPSGTSSIHTQELVSYGQAPIPGAIWLLGSGLAGLVAIRRRKK